MAHSRIQPYLLIAVLLVLPVSLCAAEASRTATLYAVGDIMLGRHIAKLMKTRGADFPFQDIAPALRSADIVLGNLEAVIGPDEARPFFPEKPYSFHASAASADAVRKAGFHVLSLANNHAMDYGASALFDTRKLLSEKGVMIFGAGKDIQEARSPAIVTKNGISLGFLGYGVAHSRAVYAKKNRPGIAPIMMEDIRRDIQALRGRVDVVVVSLHWGMEYESVPSARQREEAHSIIDWGADLIIGHHPHVMQGLEVYKGRVIAYSLGNFIFDQKGKGTDRSFVLAVVFNKQGIVSGRIIPLDRKDRYIPKIAHAAAGRGIVDELKQISLPINAERNKLVFVGLGE